MPSGRRGDHEIIVDTDQEDRRLDPLHTSVRKFGTISNIAEATKLEGGIRCKASTS